MFDSFYNRSFRNSKGEIMSVMDISRNPEVTKGSKPQTTDFYQFFSVSSTFQIKNSSLRADPYTRIDCTRYGCTSSLDVEYYSELYDIRDLIFSLGGNK